DHQFPPWVRADAVEVGSLQLVSLLEIGDAFFDERPRHLGTRNILRRSKEHGSARDDDPQLIGCERYGLVHFLEAPRPKLAAFLHVLLLKGLTGFIEQTGSMPYQGFRIFGIGH